MGMASSALPPATSSPALRACSAGSDGWAEITHAAQHTIAISRKRRISTQLQTFSPPQFHRLSELLFEQMHQPLTVRDHEAVKLFWLRRFELRFLPIQVGRLWGRIYSGLGIFRTV